MESNEAGDPIQMDGTDYCTHTHTWCIDDCGNEWHKCSTRDGELVSYCRQSAWSPSLNPRSLTSDHLLPQLLWLLAPSQATLLFFWVITWYFLMQIFFNSRFFLFPLFSDCCLCSSFFCPSGVGDSRQCWEACGLLIKKQGGTRPQLTRTHTDICIALLALLALPTGPSAEFSHQRHMPDLRPHSTAL